jgi:osmotically-inducible protein OsmY
MADDSGLVQLVKDELHRHPDVDTAAIAVSGGDGHVTLRGTVGSPGERTAAGKAAARVFGVVAVDNELEVASLNARGREDAEVRAGVLAALMRDPSVPTTVDVRVEGGIGTLTGTAKWQYQRAAAGAVAGGVVGEQHVRNEIELVQPLSPDASAVEERITRHDRLRIATSAGKLTITGTVRSWAERDEAITAAWATPGVVAVEDRINVAA